MENTIVIRKTTILILVMMLVVMISAILINVNITMMTALRLGDQQITADYAN